MRAASPGNSANSQSKVNADPPASLTHGTAQSSSQSGSAPPGNNGTIKVDQLSMDPGQDTDPHLPCELSISFFGYDLPSDTAVVILTPWAPTAGGHTFTSAPTTISAPAPRRGNEFDGNIQISSGTLETMFSGVTPAHAGFHLRVEAEVTGSQGSDDKFKMVWVTCPTNTSPPPVTPVTPVTPATPVTPSITPAAPTKPATVLAVTGVVQVASTAAAHSASVAPAAGVPLARPATPVPAPGALAFTGANIALLVELGLGLIAGGCLLILRRRRRAPVSTG